MQNSYSYWRAAHPLVFITIHLLVGILIANELPTLNLPLKNQFLALAFGFSLLILFGVNYYNKSIHASGITITIIVICWGIALQWSLQNAALFHIPYPEKYIMYCRAQVIQKINKTIVNKEANGFSLALLLSVKSDMNKSLVNAYTQLGIIHIIAISGMHLEILFKNLTRLTRQLPRKRFYLALELLLLLICVWTYTLMAFASPSIVRASVFFTIYAIGKFIGASTMTLNIIAGGILIILLIDHKQLQNIGLQLSYAAVIGIHLFYKLIYKLVPLDNPIIAFLWSNFCMSLAAQLTTFPILIYHFKYISSWVLVSNFVMVPLSNLILYGLGIVLVLPLTYSIANYWGYCVEKYILFFNGIINNWYTNLHMGTLMLALTSFQILLYYFALLFIYLWLYTTKPRFLIVGIGGIIGIILLKLFS